MAILTSHFCVGLGIIDKIKHRIYIYMKRIKINFHIFPFTKRLKEG